MVFDLTFEEAMDVLYSRVGWVQGEKFSNDEYLSLDRKKGIIVRNKIKEGGCVVDGFSKYTQEAWSGVNMLDEEMKTQKYRFILVLCDNAVKGLGAFSEGDSKDSYLWYKKIINSRKD